MLVLVFPSLFWPSVDEEKTRKEYIEDIVKHLKNKDVCKVVLHGIKGVGKTWIAREVAKHALNKNIVDVTIWLYLHTHYFEANSDSDYDSDDGLLIYNEDTRKNEKDFLRKLYNNILHQLSAQQVDPSAEYHLEDRDMDSRSLCRSLKAKLNGKKYLMVLDGENGKLDVHAFMGLLNEFLDSANKESSKVLITTLSNDNDFIKYSYDANRRSVSVKVKPLTASESVALFKRNWKRDQTQLLDDAYVMKIVQGCNYLPSSIVFRGNVLRYTLENGDDDLNKTLAVLRVKKDIDGWLMLAYEKFVNDSILFRCFSLCCFYLEVHGFVNYNELILNLMLEGYFENETSLEKAYAQAHNVVMKLIDAGLLGEREGGDIVLESIVNEFVEAVSPITCRTTHQDFSCTFYKLKGGSDVKRTKTSLAALRKAGKGTNEKLFLDKLIVKGNTSAPITEQFKINDPYATACVRILLLSHVDPIINLQNMDKLRVLIIRGCNSPLEHIKIKDIANLEKLQVLEISGCFFSYEIPEDLYTLIVSLEHLNLSSTWIQSFPKIESETLATIGKLGALILRRCLQLKSFPDVSGFTVLKVLDLSGSNLNSVKKKSWTLEGLPKLEVLDLSETSLYDFPGVMHLESLTHLLLKNCPLLNKVRPLNKLMRLEVIDASGCTSLHFFRKVNLPTGDCLRKLDLSYTMIRNLPPLKNASNLVELRLKGCSQLKELPLIEGAIELRVLDVSDCINVEKINASFKDMKSLIELLLSNTKIKTLPSLSGLKSVQKVVLRGCEALQTLPDMGMLNDLLLLDVRGCIALERSINEPLNDAIILNITDP
ncbi:unnamed protein product [Amaranthus hypochondriacus]